MALTSRDVAETFSDVYEFVDGTEASLTPQEQSYVITELTHIANRMLGRYEREGSIGKLAHELDEILDRLYANLGQWYDNGPETAEALDYRPGYLAVAGAFVAREKDEIALGMVVIDDHGREGIVAKQWVKPKARWIKQQENAKAIAELPPSTSWWIVVPLQGGSVHCPAPFLFPIRDATYEDFLVAYANANSCGKYDLSKLFPAFTEHLVQQGTPTA